MDVFKKNKSFKLDIHEVVRTKSASPSKDIGFQSNINEHSSRDVVNSLPPSQNLWNRINPVVKSKLIYVDSTNRFVISSRFLLLILVICTSLSLIVFNIASILKSMDHHRQPTFEINKTVKYDGQRDTIESNIATSMPTYTVSSILQKINLIPLTTPSLSLQSIITSQTELSQQKSTEVHLNLKHNISSPIQAGKINFYTTSNKRFLTVKVVPTLSSSMKTDVLKSTLEEISTQNDTNNCQSTSLPICQGISPYDLTDSLRKWNLTNIEYQHFTHLLNSNCSNRAQQYVCRILEPECRPTSSKVIQPCRKICKGIFESCSHIIASSKVLTELFDCDSTTDEQQCEDITRSFEGCFENEFQCSDFSCIPLKWRCDNILDCQDGDDEDKCKFCNYDEFKCISDEVCISDKAYCDGILDCIDGSDEKECDKDVEYGDTHRFTSFDDESEQNNSAYDYDTFSDDKIVSTGNGVIPTFIDPNNTTSSVSYDDYFDKFGNITRKITINETITSTSTIKPNTFLKTSHESSCSENYLRCVDGLCITLNQICDKIQDCSDNSDEVDCEY